MIMSFFGALFAAMTLYWQWQVTGLLLLALPFLGFALIALAALRVIRRPGTGLAVTPKEEKAIIWATIGEGVGLFLVANFAVNLHRTDLLMPGMALVVGLHFLPIALATSFRPFGILGGALIAAALAGVLLAPPTGGQVAGLAAALALWVASTLAVIRDGRAKGLVRGGK
jgi:hypothetical protein